MVEEVGDRSSLHLSAARLTMIDPAECEFLSLLEGLFTGAEAGRQSIEFQWHVIRRNRRPFLLLPRARNAARVGLGLYSAHRPAARLGRSLLSLGTPFSAALPK